MRLLAIDVCPLWQEPNGWRRPGMTYEPDHPPVVGWVVVATLELAGQQQQLLVTREAA